VGPYNPYSPPGAIEAAPGQGAAKPLFGPSAIAAHTILLTPLVGAVLATINHRRRGDAAGVRRTLLMFLVPTLVLTVAQLAASERLGGVLRFVSLGWTVTVARQLYVEHRVLFDAHVAAGGKAARWYLATLAAVALLIGVVVIASLVWILGMRD
jgi:hypothetical protein